MQSYKNKVVIITGAGKGIGRTLARTYGELEAQVILIDKEESYLNETELIMAESGAFARSIVLDLVRPEEIVSAFEEIKIQYGRVDVLINNAGIGKPVSPYNLTLEDWDEVINTNLRGSFLCSREAAKIMKENNGGSVIMISSTRALMSEPDTEAYAASKGGLLALTHALAISLGPDHIMVNAISPGWIETGDYADLAKSDHQQHPAGIVGKPEDIARACMFLTDPANRFVTGSNFIIDGGMTRKMIYS